MLEFSQMVYQLVVALFLGALMGLEREIIGKEAGVRTNMLVAGGAAIFTMIALALPVQLGELYGNTADIAARNSGFLTIIANIVVGIGFLGAGIIIKTQERVHGLTTAATVWATASIGVLAGMGQISFAFVSTILLAGLLYLLRDFDIAKIKDRER
ncbi:MAG: MgtC/SapB family protein [Candidatus Liptonbacteria bacterium]|nr:MgtC/SapB family protein [Candidatus Liptonbacteria bacterium]